MRWFLSERVPRKPPAISRCLPVGSFFQFMSCKDPQWIITGEHNTAGPQTVTVQTGALSDQAKPTPFFQSHDVRMHERGKFNSVLNKNWRGPDIPHPSNQTGWYHKLDDGSHNPYREQKRRNYCPLSAGTPAMILVMPRAYKCSTLFGHQVH